MWCMTFMKSGSGIVRPQTLTLSLSLLLAQIWSSLLRDELFPSVAPPQHYSLSLSSPGVLLKS